MKIITLRQEYNSNTISREDFWAKCQTNHRVLDSYKEILGNSEISSLEITASDLLLHLNSGVTMLWNIDDIRSSANSIVNHGWHEQDDGEFLKRSAHNKEIIFDIGANAGYYALHFARENKTVKQVHAFEPNPKVFTHLTRNIELNDLQHRISTHPFALGRQSGFTKFFVPKFSGSCAGSLKMLHPEEINEEQNIQIETLDTYCKNNSINRIDLIKIDAEGGESDIIDGGWKTISNLKPTLFIEILRKWTRAFEVDPNSIFRRLNSLGYLCWAVQSGQLVHFDKMTNETEQTNFFFTHPDKEPDPQQWATYEQ